jgi:hypothetical protein
MFLLKILEVSMNFYFNQVKDDFIQENIPNIDQGISKLVSVLLI